MVKDVDGEMLQFLAIEDIIPYKNMIVEYQEALGFDQYPTLHIVLPIFSAICSDLHENSMGFNGSTVYTQSI